MKRALPRLMETGGSSSTPPTTKKRGRPKRYQQSNVEVISTGVSNNQQSTPSALSDITNTYQNSADHQGVSSTHNNVLSPENLPIQTANTDNAPLKRKRGRPRKDQSHNTVPSPSVVLGSENIYPTTISNIINSLPHASNFASETATPLSEITPPPKRKRIPTASTPSSASTFASTVTEKTISPPIRKAGRRRKNINIGSSSFGSMTDGSNETLNVINQEEFMVFCATDSENDDNSDNEGLHPDRHNSGVSTTELIHEQATLEERRAKATDKAEKNKQALQIFVNNTVKARCVEPGLSPNGYLDAGDPSFTCTHCGAYMWYGERIQKRSKNKIPVFTLCCKQGKVKLPLLKTPPASLLALLLNGDDRSKHFREFIRAYNMMFSFTSLGGKINHAINNGAAPYLFQLCGENYHLIGDILPKEDNDPAFLQLYIHDTPNEISNRIKAYSKTGNGEKIEANLVSILKKMLDNHNPHVKAFRQARDKIDLDRPAQGFKLRLAADRSTDGRTHNVPTVEEVAGLIPGDFNFGTNNRDIIIESRSGGLHRISELHPAYLPLQYPLLFPYGEDGFRLGIDIGFVDTAGRKRTKITMREFFAFRIQERLGESPLIVMSGKLYQQFLVDVYTMIESNRLRYLWYNQSKLRSDNYDSIQNAADNGDGDLSNQGRRIFIPSSFTGGARFMMQHYLDAMATCKFFGYPDLFITITCNPKWPEITRYLEKHNLRPEDRPDICCRIFKIKLDSLIEDLTKNDLLGKVRSAMYTIEFQKRGLPHAHMVLFLHPDNKLPTPEDIDKIISAELPDKDLDPDLYEVVSDVMLHGPCGEANHKAPCMVDRKCSKFFPKPFSEITTIDDAGFPIYKRRQDGRKAHKRGFDLDNGYVVPYNKELSIRYRAHINVEWCNQTRSIKYLFKYIAKGPDYVKASVRADNSDEPIDEIKSHFSCRYISSNESSWRILAFPTLYRTTPVERLPFHLEGQQQVIFNELDPAEEVLNRPSCGTSKFLSFFDCCKVYPEAKNLTYADFPTHFVWNKKERTFKPRKRGFAIGRITYVPISCGEPYYLRVLLNVVKGPTSFKDLKTVANVLYKTHKEACYAMGLLDDDKEFIDAITEAAHWSSGKYLRRLFVIILLSKGVSEPVDVWNATSEMISEDMLTIQRKKSKNPNLSLSPDQLKNLALAEIEKLMRLNGDSLKNYKPMPLPNDWAYDRNENQMMTDELNFNHDNERSLLDDNLALITDEQRVVYNEILDAVNNERGGMFFVYGFGGTGKTFLWSTLSASLRSRGLIILNVASSGIAALLLPGGRTAHSRFSIPINVNEWTTCSISKGSNQAELIGKAKLIIWDEAPMMSRHCFETLDRTMRDVLGCDKPFGGKVVVFGGDFRQILPVVTDGGRTETVLAALNSSYLWPAIKVLRLTKNMRLLAGIAPDEALELKAFSEWILRIGDGTVEGCGNEDPDSGETEIEIPDDMLIHQCEDPTLTIVEEVYGTQWITETNPRFYRDKAILSPTNADVDKVNEYMLNQLPAEESIYLSSDSIDPSDAGPLDDMLYGIEYLNSIKISGLPLHELKLKVGAPIMLLRNVDAKSGLCNGTRLLITQMAKHVIQARIITGNDDLIGKKVLIPRMYVSPPDARFPFRMRRRQFPVALAFAMTINKSQGQTLGKVGLFLPNPVFTHGQLYVAFSRVKSRSGIKILITDKEGNPQKTTTNVVYKEVFSNIK